jgi:hypothetical protein
MISCRSHATDIVCANKAPSASVVRYCTCACWSSLMVIGFEMLLSVIKLLDALFLH